MSRTPAPSPTAGARRARRPVHHATAALALLVVLGAALAGCGGSSSDAGGGGADDGGGPTVTIEHRYGTTEVPVDPERIVSLDTQWTDVLTALDAPPAGFIADPNRPDGSFPWRGDRLDGSTPIEAVDALPYERIAELRPDLIVVSYLAQSKGDYEKLSAIAPTVATLSEAEVDTWQDITAAAGEVLDDEAGADQLVADVDAEVAAVGEELPGLDGKSYALVNYVAGDNFYVVSDPDDGAAVLFDQLGLSIVDSILDAADGEAGRVEVSLENASLFDADLLLLLTNGADPGEIAGFDNLRAVRSGAVAELDYATAVGVNTPTPLSIPWSLEQLRPALEAAAG